jgi:alanyl-tRNA synthetase
VSSLKEGETGLILLNQTPFYGESGGQVGDHGFMIAPAISVKVANVQKKLGELFVHEGMVERGELTLGQPLDLLVDHERRAAVRANHSATHLLHEALRQVLGDHVAQKGSLVAPDRLRFDFAHPKPISAEELTRVEEIANSAVLQNAPVTTRLMAQEQAIESGARALFGEKYGDEVRVVSMGYAEPPADQTVKAAAFSTELCGGTHVSRTGDIGLISIVSEGAVAAGVRRIEAKTAAEARHHLNVQALRLHDIAALLKAPEDEVSQRLASLIDERRKLERELTEARRKLAMGGGDAGAPAAEDIDGVKFLRKAVSGIDMKDLKPLADDAKQSIGSGVVAIVGVAPDGKAGVVVGVTADLTARFDAVALVQAASSALGGKGGGGRRDLAQAGGPNGDAAEAALDAVSHALREKAHAA